eukprot:26412-Eustigmatos_ZCMA.PRE.1
MKEKNLSGEIVLGDADIHYHKPTSLQPRAICNIESVDIHDGHNPVAEFKGVYWVLPPTEE